MTTLSLLHEPAILHNLYIRYRIDQIYTYSGLKSFSPAALHALFSAQALQGRS